MLEGLSCGEVAEILGTPVATVWTRIHHARAELQRALMEDAFRPTRAARTRLTSAPSPVLASAIATKRPR